MKIVVFVYYLIVIWLVVNWKNCVRIYSGVLRFSCESFLWCLVVVIFGRGKLVILEFDERENCGIEIFFFYLCVINCF